MFYINLPALGLEPAFDMKSRDYQKIMKK